jgi:nucleotide-binding universal stress UspA family protein
MHGDAAVYEILHEARDRAKAAGARDIEERAVVGAAVDALVKLAEDVKADLLVVGDVGLDSVAGRLLGSVPADVARKAKVDILIVHTAG